MGIVKILDNIILTAKSISTYKEQKILSSFLVVLSQFTFYFIISKVVSDENIIPIIIVSISSGIGNYIAFLINDQFKRDDMWTNILTCKDMEDMVRLCEVLRNHNIRYIANQAYDREWNDTYSVTIFAATKNESKMIDKYIEKANIKYLRRILK